MNGKMNTEMGDITIDRDVLAKYADATGILTALRNNKVCIPLGRLNELLMHRLEDLQVSVDNHRDSASAVYCITLDIPYQPFVRITVDKYLQVHHVPELMVYERHDALDDYHRLRFHGSEKWYFVKIWCCHCSLS